MSFSDAIGQVNQIVQWEQQLADPAALSPSPAAGATAATGEAGSAALTSAGSFSSALAQAQAQGGTATGAPEGSTTAPGGLLSGPSSQLLSLLQTASTGSTAAAAGAVPSAASTVLGAPAAPALTGTGSTAPATSPADPRVQSMIAAADSLVGKPYVWGGGHNNFGPQTGYDCSGFVSAVLHAGGYLSSPQDTETLPSAPGIESGPGRYVTLYDRTTPGQEGHVIMEINGQFYESGGEQGSWGGGGGVQKIATPSAAYLSTFNLILHPAGL
jgi:cell wall-associated NlpC family hydrolase